MDKKLSHIAAVGLVVVRLVDGRRRLYPAMVLHYGAELESGFGFACFAFW